MRMIYHTIRELLLLLIVSYMFLNFAEKLLVDTVLCYQWFQGKIFCCYLKAGADLNYKCYIFHKATCFATKYYQRSNT